MVKSRLARGYSRAAPVYDALAGPLYLMGIRRLLPRLRLPPMPAILDVGCGTGINLIETAHRFAPTGLLCGIDLSPGMVETAQAKAKALGIPAVITQGDAERLPYPDNTFDLIICNSVLHWFHDREAAVREMSRVLRPGGQLALICAAFPGYQEWFTFMGMLLGSLGAYAVPFSFPRLPDTLEVACLLQSGGLSIEHIARSVQHQLITDPKRFIRLMSTVAPCWSGELPPETQTAVETLAATRMKVRWPAGFPNTWAAIEAVATRLPSS